MQAPLILLLLSCIWTMVCSRRPQSKYIEKDQSQDIKNPYHSLERQPPQNPLKTLQRNKTKHMRSSKSLSIDCIPSIGTPYTSRANTTEYGHPCMKWSLEDSDYYNFTDFDNDNFCRDTYGELKVWCYFETQKHVQGLDRAYCDVPVCGSKGI